MSPLAQGTRTLLRFSQTLGPCKSVRRAHGRATVKSPVLSQERGGGREEEEEEEEEEDHDSEDVAKSPLTYVGVDILEGGPGSFTLYSCPRTFISPASRKAPLMEVDVHHCTVQENESSGKQAGDLSLAPRWSSHRGEEGHNGRWTPSKRMFCERWERRWGWCEGSGVPGDRFASGDSPIHLSLTLTPGARGEQSACGQGKSDPSHHTSPPQPCNTL
ncbi:unnamed protein product [Pleuronectes platessa]|uniref:Uncharacterized protein n=1 Tax=Pleuronectes platessa TaxID=8262 RepID=A0A9N7TL36_PLEPL|nr:unnamed protein product [Pleuronectes platessa]